MQKNVTRIIAILLAVILAVVAFVVPVFAEEDCCNEGEDNGGYVVPENPDHRDIDGEFVSERGSIIIGHHGDSGTPDEYYFHKYGAYKILDKFYMGNGNDGKPVYQYRITPEFANFKPVGYRFNPKTGAIYVADGEREESSYGDPGETWEDTESVITIFRRLTGEDGLLTDNTNSGVLSSLAAQLQKYVHENKIEPTVMFEAGMAYRVVYGYYLILELENNAKDPDALVATKPILANVDECGVVLVSKDSRVALDKEIIENNQELKENDYAVGDTITYCVTSNFPTYAADVNAEDIVFNFSDALSEGQVFNSNDVIITVHQPGVVADTLLQNNTDYTLSRSDNELHVSFFGETVLKYAGCTLQFKYATVLTEAAVINADPAAENDARIVFKNNPGISDELNEVKDKTKVFTYGLDFKKLKDETSEYVSGARFRLEYKSPDGKVERVLGFTKKSNGNGFYGDVYVVGGTDTEFVTDGKEIRFYGLDAGSYRLIETGAPSGYALLRDPIVFTITPDMIKIDDTHQRMSGTAIITTTNVVEYDIADEKVLGFEGEVNANLIIRNYEGVSIPETGSVASIIIMVIGGIVLLGGIVFFILKSRKDREDDEDDE